MPVTASPSVASVASASSNACVWSVDRSCVRAPVPPPASDGDATTRVVALVRAQAPLRRALARVAGRLVEARAWERLGYARLRD